MKSIIPFAALLTLLPAFTAATPFKRQISGAFSMIAIHSGDERVHLQAINANSNLFWVGRPTSTFCPSEPIITCPPGNETVLDASAGSPSYISTSHLVPGEQNVYVQGPTQPTPGALSFNSAHSAVPIEGIENEFTFTGSDLVYAGGDWWACPAMGAYYVQAATQSPGEFCIDIGIHTFPYTGQEPAAWQYE